MFQPAFAFIGLRYARASKSSHFIAFINFFSVAGIALGITALITVSSVMNGFEDQLKQRILGIVPHLLIKDPQKTLSSESVLAMQHVIGSGAQVEAEALVQGQRGLQGVQIQGVEPDVMQKYSAITENMLTGSLLQLAPKSYQVVIGAALARQLGVQTGDQVRLIVAGAMVYTPLGPMPSQRMFTVSGIFDLSSELDDKVVLMNISDAARLMRKPLNNVAQQRLFLDDAFAYKQVENQLYAMSDKLQIESWRAREGALFDAVKMEKNMMALMMMLIVAVAAFNIVSALVMVVTEKRGDIAILRTQGMTAGDILKIFLTNGLYNGVKGTSLGLAGGLLLATQLNHLTALLGVVVLPGSSQLPVVIAPNQVITVVVLSLLLTFVATLYPAYRAANVNPASALRYE
ncbi:lipoprotein-releasing ABC transporter permease subunit [Neptunicella marina]|uniref:Lipoprotein-releasing ABC transporter permease subunit n=1 Tax=Neptunicella marina TaxID=2125989 RepID=A0A8J6M094_9ALTE|nr:lipoprotein-releasing ABC transporter permease subunit [Neptunicella marina]MBC3767015.1 lipoprotein-releasing ABC transporter permease subunit [Neptunicella marina]